MVHFFNEWSSRYQKIIRIQWSKNIISKSFRCIFYWWVNKIRFLKLRIVKSTKIIGDDFLVDSWKICTFANTFTLHAKIEVFGFFVDSSRVSNTYFNNISFLTYLYETFIKIALLQLICKTDNWHYTFLKYCVQ